MPAGLLRSLLESFQSLDRGSRSSSRTSIARSTLPRSATAVASVRITASTRCSTSTEDRPAMIQGGFAGRILRVDLTRREVTTEPLDFALATQFIGGLGLTVKLAADAIEPGTDALSPDTPFVLGAGPLVGTNLPSTSRVFAVAKMPTTAHRLVRGRWCQLRLPAQERGIRSRRDPGAGRPAGPPGDRRRRERSATRAGCGASE